MDLADAVVGAEADGVEAVVDSQVGVAVLDRVAGFLVEAEAEVERGHQLAAHRRLIVRAAAVVLVAVRDLRCQALVPVPERGWELVRDQTMVMETAALVIGHRCSREPDRTSEQVLDRVHRPCLAISREPGRDRELALGKALPIDPVGRRLITTATRSISTTSTVIIGSVLITAALVFHSSQLGCQDWGRQVRACRIKELGCRTTWRTDPSRSRIGRVI